MEKRITLRATEEFHQTVNHAAHDMRMTMTEFIRFLVDQHLKNFQKEEK